MEEVTHLSAAELMAAYRQGSLSPIDSIEGVERRLASIGSAINATTALCLERARIEARASEQRYRTGAALPLDGVPFLAKDLLNTAGVVTSYGSALFAGNVPSVDAQAVANLRRCGGILVGKAATHEFGWGIRTSSPHPGPTRNPWALDRVPGGSSGGSAAALAARIVPIAIGSDTGGSIRMPAAFCGVVGFKPTYGKVSAAGVFPLARSLDHVGPMARDVRDATALFAALLGPEAALARRHLADFERDRLQEPAEILRGLRIGVCGNTGAVGLAPEVAEVFDQAVRSLEGVGATLCEVELPDASRSYEAFAAILLAEALDEHRTRKLFPQRKTIYGLDVQARMLLAEQLTRPALEDARRAREHLRTEMAGCFKSIELLLSPVSAGPPARCGEEPVVHQGVHIEFRHLVMPFVVQQNLTGIPACAVRAGFDAQHLPVAIQISGPVGADLFVLQAADAFFRLSGAVQRSWPDLSANASQ